MAATKVRKHFEVERSSGNVFADLGLPNPEEHLVKAALALAIARTIRERGLTQEQAGNIRAGGEQHERSERLLERLVRCPPFGLQRSIIVALVTPFSPRA